ncbi:MAG: hypothetical protein AB1816_07680, partial [Bacillota bacterium]
RCLKGGCAVRRVGVRGDSEERAYRRPFDPEVAAQVLDALGVDGFARVVQCWVCSVSGLPKRQAVLVRMRETWRVRGEDTGVPVERVFYLRHDRGEWYLDGSCRTLPNELDAVFDRGPVSRGRTPLESLVEQVYEEAESAAGIGRGVVPEYSKESAEWYGMHIDRRRA